METSLTIKLSREEINQAINDQGQKKLKVKPASLKFADDSGDTKEDTDVVSCILTVSETDIQKLVKF